MELIFLDRTTLTYQDHGFVDNDFEMVMDIVVNQKSNFMVNKTNIQSSIGDIVVLKENDYSYLGVIETMEVTDEIKTKVQANDFKEIFNVKVPISSFSGDICQFLKSTIEKYFITSNDRFQNLSYLKVIQKISVQGELNFDADKLMAITELIELIHKTFGINLKYQVEFLRGRFAGIVIMIDSVSTGVRLKNHLSCISDVVISDSKEQMTNKVIFYPKRDNATYRSIISYYLLKNGKITTNSRDEERYSNVSFTCEFYSDEDYKNLSTKAMSLLSSTNLDHSITFAMTMDNSVMIPLKTIYLGDYIEFITSNKTYHTVITQLKFKNDFTKCFVTLGEFRTKLTDKIKLLQKNTTSAVGNISISGSAVVDLDGGTY